MPTFHLHSSVNSVGCHQDHFSTRVRVSSSKQEFYACQRSEFKNFRQLSAEQHLCHSLSTPIWKENAKEHVPVKHCDVCMYVCVCVRLCLQRFILRHVFGHVWSIPFATLGRGSATKLRISNMTVLAGAASQATLDAAVAWPRPSRLLSVQNCNSKAQSIIDSKNLNRDGKS